MGKIYFLILGLVLCLSGNAQVINFPDANFKTKLLEADTSNSIAKNLANQYFKVDTNSDNEIDVSEALNVSYLQISSCNITSVEGLSFFLNIKYLYCWYNQINSLDLSGLSNLIQVDCFESHIANINLTGLTSLTTLNSYQNLITSIDVTGLNSIVTLNVGSNMISNLQVQDLNNLVTLTCAYNQLTSLSLSGLPNLKNLYCQYNLLTSIDVSSLPNLYNFYCYFNNLTSLDVSNLSNLNFFDCYNNDLTSINLTGLTNLKKFYCQGNLLTSLDVTDLIELTDFRCGGNLIQTLDVSHIKSLNIFDCYGNNLSSLFLKNGRAMTLNFGGNIYLNYICIDEQYITWMHNLCNDWGVINCEVNSYCSFVPGGAYYSLIGSSRLDVTGNNCSSSNQIFPDLKLNISNTTNSGSFVSNNSGEYIIPLQSGSHTVTPMLENPTYFNINPTSFSVTFPSTNPYLQDFCITPNGIHNDLEVAIVPLLPARPGFNTTYKVVYKNKGNTTLSGSVTFEFEDDKMDLVTSTPLFSLQTTGLLTYDYINLQPFETREILLMLNINSPMESPAVNIGDQLDFTAIINPLSNDEYLADNTSSLKQIVVGSYDPNDKTCVEGTIVGPEMIGQYVHYVIRFENTGTFPAENIVVKDMIDLTKFDLSTLIPTNSSHSYVTRIAIDGKVEFIFENIQLPFDDDNNDGYIAFKIKTLPSLMVGDTFSNKANIYFDYNFPIETNTASTMIQALGNSDFDFEEYLTLYPNPTKNKLNIKTNNTILITSMNIYNSLGQLVLVATNPSESIDVSGLKTGSYFVKVVTDKGISNSKFIKE